MSAFLKRLIPKKAPEEQVVRNPFKLLASISLEGHLLLISGWLAWTMDGYDYFSVSLTATLLAKQFSTPTYTRPVSSITTAITLTLLFRSVGAVLFGVLSDRFGRKWTLIGNLLLIAVFELATGFVNDYSSFLAVRSLFGIAMGGIWGQASNTALENVPANARGLISGFLQQGYAMGYLVAAVVNLTVVPYNVHSWRTIYWIGAGLSVFAALFRACLPESKTFRRAQEEAKRNPPAPGGPSKGKLFLREMGAMLRAKWLLAIWAVLLMTGFNFLSHGSQDLYPTYLTANKLLPSTLSSKATIIANCGAVAGGILFGYASQFIGRRLAIILALIWTACFIPLWIIPNSFAGLSAGAFFVQFGVQGAWGVIPIYLAESSPPAFRATFGGVAYQLGNMVSSAAAQIEATAGEHLRAKSPTGIDIPDYAKIMGILLGVVIAWTMVFTLIGPENHSAHFEEAAVAFEEGAGKADNKDYLTPEQRKRQDSEMGEMGEAGFDHKVQVEQVEKVDRQ